MANISILLPVYNGADLIEQAIKSVLSQPYNDWELIIMNDGSTDETSEIIKKYSLCDPRIKEYYHSNTGLGKNRNLGFKHLTGKWTIFLDHDDMIIENFITAKLVKFLEECNEKGIELIVPARIRTDYEGVNATIDYVDYEGVIDGGNIPSWMIKYEFATLLYSTSLLLKNNILFNETKPEMESIFRHKAAYLAKKVLFTNQLYFGVRRANYNSIVNTWDYSKVIPIRFKAYYDLIEWHETVNPLDKKAVERTKLEVFNIVMEYISTFTISDLNDKNQEIRSNGMYQAAKEYNRFSGFKARVRFLVFTFSPYLYVRTFNTHSCIKKEHRYFNKLDEYQTIAKTFDEKYSSILKNIRLD